MCDLEKINIENQRLARSLNVPHCNLLDPIAERDRLRKLTVHSISKRFRQGSQLSIV